MASTSPFREVCEEDEQNVLQSVIPEKKQRKLQSMESRFLKVSAEQFPK